MFKKSRRKIVAAIMSVLALLWVGTLAVIYASSYYEMSKQNRGMLREHAEQYVLSQPFDAPPPAKPEPDLRKPHYLDLPSFQLSTFYTVAMTYDGKLLEINNPQQTVYSEEELEGFARDVLADDKVTGVKNNLIYYTMDKGGYMLVSFKDNTIIQESMGTLFRYTLIFGGLAIVALFFLAIYLARQIVKPLEESYQKQKQFISDAGHELKTPISIVSTNAELLARELGDNKWLANIQYENERMGLLVSQLLELSRIEHVLPQREPIDFSHLVNGEALPFESVAYENGLILNCSVMDNIVLEGNSVQLKQLVSILLDNAIRYGNSGKDVQLILKAEDGSARLSVINAGEAIAPEQRKQLFERFYRVDAVRNGEDGHYGLGLAIAKAITLSHGGKISVHCDHGLVEFKVQIPIRKFSYLQ
jgi:signal transduction histidine kinase